MRKTWACIAGGLLVASSLAAPPAVAAVPRATTKAEVVKRGVRIHSQADKTSAMPGDKVTYTIQVSSTAERVLRKVRVTGNLSQVLDNATYNNDASGPASYGAAELRWTFTLGAGKSKTFTYSVTVKSSSRTDDSLRTKVTLKVPKAGKAKACETVVRVKEEGKPPPSLQPPPPPQPPKRDDDLEVEKKADRKAAKRGEKVAYTVAIKNPAGNDKVLAVDFIDNLTDVLDDATYNGDAKASMGDAPMYEAPELRWTGKLGPGESVQLGYTVTMKRTGFDNEKLINEVIVPGSNCAQGSSDPKCSTEVLLVWLKIDKKVDPDRVLEPGETVNYSLVITNVGTFEFVESKPVTIDDDLTGLLDDANYNHDASPPSRLENGHLRWEVALAPGEVKTFTYSATVKDGDVLAGDDKLDNTVKYEMAVEPAENPGDYSAGDDPCTGTCKTSHSVRPRAALRLAREKPGAGCSAFRSVVIVDPGRRLTGGPASGG